MNIPCYAKKAIEILESCGYEAYLVGGFVRDALLKRECFDIDITTSALPEQIKEAFFGYKVIETGIRHGTVTVIIDSQHIEITTFREDKGYSDHRHPDSAAFTKSLENDLSRRDFTINALAYNPKTGIVDMFSGISDLENKIIRAVGEAQMRFEEDALRILRGLRFASMLGFEIEEKTADAIKNKKELLGFVSRERAFSELMKMLSYRGVNKILCDFEEVFSFALGVGKLNLEKIDSIPDIAEQKLAYILLNEDFADALNSLKADTKTKTAVKNICECSREEITCDSYKLKCLLRKYGKSALFAAININGSDKEILKQTENIIKNGECFNLEGLKINGKRLIELGFKGEEIGKILDELLCLVMKNKVENDAVSLENALKSLK